MFDFWTIVYLLFIGIVAGFAARIFVSGEGPMRWWQTMLVGIVGSYLGGFLFWLLFGFDDDEGAVQPGGIVGSILGAVLVLLAYRAIRSRSDAR